MARECLLQYTVSALIVNKSVPSSKSIYFSYTYMCICMHVYCNHDKTLIKTKMSYLYVCTCMCSYVGWMGGWCCHQNDWVYNIIICCVCCNSYVSSAVYVLIHAWTLSLWKYINKRNSSHQYFSTVFLIHKGTCLAECELFVRKMKVVIFQSY